jgi:uncharacterized membrane protein
MPDLVVQGLVLLTHLLEIAGASALVAGFVVATMRWIHQMRKQDVLSATTIYRKSLGRSMLIGLEILVAATIIKTISVDPSLKSMAFLAIMVVIRTILGWTTVLEISGRWPWQKSSSDIAESSPTI